VGHHARDDEHGTAGDDLAVGQLDRAQPVAVHHHALSPPAASAPPLVSNELVVTGLDHLLAGLSTMLVGGTGERCSPEVAALLLGAWAVGALAVGVVTRHRRDP
jgi:hypothetical protein